MLYKIHISAPTALSSCNTEKGTEIQMVDVCIGDTLSFRTTDNSVHNKKPVMLTIFSCETIRSALCQAAREKNKMSGEKQHLPSSHRAASSL